ncbi:type II toxin-antitoxin system HicB family antitoxin [Paenibacillus silvae]|uniref:type II toxin-antitoxin system HicB family antitoxin n=1 Tax=Paenibacillus silvae TaxID=1325358 RepID=UPI0025A092E0|nr:type II toxin-antitoxin system HicB family antitoxin [Paenibacillus silvae]MDM5276190.1 type II toxin-antitoxin system HicB family antitoxin [Paenibacillus silvae]
MIRTYQYYAIFNFADDGINVSFPDLPGCLTYGHILEEALIMAKDALGLYLDGEPVEELPLPQTIPELSNPNDKAYLIEASIHYYGHGSVQDAGK